MRRGCERVVGEFVLPSEFTVLRSAAAMLCQLVHGSLWLLLLCQTFRRMACIFSFALGSRSRIWRPPTESLNLDAHCEAHSRYFKDFQEMKPLGKGAYGTVCKVRNLLDGQFYAVKKIPIHKTTSNDLIKVLREAEVLASLQHGNIVRYHTTWMEGVQPLHSRNVTVHESKISLLTDSSAQKQDGDEHSIQTRDGGSASIIFAEPHSADGNGPAGGNLNNKLVHYPDSISDCIPGAPGQHLNAHTSNTRTEENEDGIQHATTERDVQSCELEAFGEEDPFNQDEDSVFSRGYSSKEGCSQNMTLHRQRELQYHVRLYIQMQLCDRTLRDWITDRNGKPGGGREATDPYRLVDGRCALNIVKQLLEGVRYMHAMGVMHRDLKPRNIFLHGPDLHVRIGDFGSACRDVIQDETAQRSEIDKTNVLTHTSGVGTSFYAAPEQLQGSHYNFKSDMYSVGIILLELFQPFGTEMERIEVLTALRNGHVPGAFNEQWPVQSKLVKLLTSSVSSQRPSAADMLRESKLFHNTEHGLNPSRKRCRRNKKQRTRKRACR